MPLELLLHSAGASPDFIISVDSLWSLSRRAARKSANSSLSKRNTADCVGQYQRNIHDAACSEEDNGVLQAGLPVEKKGAIFFPSKSSTNCLPNRKAFI